MSKETKVVRETEEWIITWKMNSDYLSQESRNKLPTGHTQTDIVKQNAEEWVKNNPHKSIIFCYKIK